MYILNDTEFKTKTAALAYAKKYINEEIPFNTFLTIDMVKGKFLLDLLSYHPDVESKSGCGIAFFIKRRSIMGGYTLFNIRTDETEESFSYMSCLGKKFDDLATAMRSAISQFTIHFKKNNALKCCLCGTDSDQCFQVDHKSTPFSEIKRRFLESNLLAVPTKFSKDSANVACFKDCDSDFAASWVSFHNNIADYQMLCSRCNVSKSNK